MADRVNPEGGGLPDSAEGSRPNYPESTGAGHETQILPQIDLTQAPRADSYEPEYQPDAAPPQYQSVQQPVADPQGGAPSGGPGYSPGGAGAPASGGGYSAAVGPQVPQTQPPGYGPPGTSVPSDSGYEPLQPGAYQPVMPGGAPSVEADTRLGGIVGVDISRERPILSVRDLEVFYGAARVLKGISFDVYEGEIVTIIGGNGAGKSTTLKTISGVSELLKSVRGKIWYKGRRIDQLPAHKIARLGIAHVPEGRRVFPQSSVEDNLLLGAYRRFKRERRKVRAELDDIYDRFPVLAERRHRAAGLLSGGEQQMLAIARGLMSNPDFFLFDEPSLGLAPILVREVFEIINDLAAEGKTILIVEQMAVQALEIADRAYVLETGSITLEGTGQELIEDPRVKAAYLGGV